MIAPFGAAAQTDADETARLQALASWLNGDAPEDDPRQVTSSLRLDGA